MDVIMPQLGETVAEGVVTKWYKKVGDAVNADEALFDVETDKVSTEIPAPAAGTLTEILVSEGVTAKVGARLAVIRQAGDAVQSGALAPAPGTAAGPGPAPSAPTPRGSAVPPADAALRLSPVVRKLVAEHGLDPSEIRGSGRGGRVTREDVLNAISSGGRPAEARAETLAQQAAPAGTVARNVPFSSVRRRTAEHMARSWTTTPHVLQVAEADFHRVEQARRALGAQWKARHGFSLTYLPFVARAVSIALGQYPNLNASFDGDALLVHGRINIGIAVDLGGDGLVVPVLKDVPGKSLPQIAKEIHELAGKARANRLRPDDLAEGTYTISNNGAFGTVITAPIINPPQVAILSTDSVRKKPVVIESPEGDSIAIRPVGVLAQTFDHRAVDGAYAAAFLREVKAGIETRDWIQALSS